MPTLHVHHSVQFVMPVESARYVRLGSTVLNVVRHVLVAVLEDVRSTRGGAMPVLEDHMDLSVIRSVQQGAPILDVIKTEPATNAYVQITMDYTATFNAAVYVCMTRAKGGQVNVLYNVTVDVRSVIQVQANASRANKAISTERIVNHATMIA